MRAKKKKEINILVGENIRTYRVKAGYSRDKFAELVGITPRFVADAETGFVGISLTTLKKICEVLGISADRLLWNNESQLSLEEKFSHIDDKYINIVEELIQKQLEVIAIVIKEENTKKIEN